MLHSFYVARFSYRTLFIFVLHSFRVALSSCYILFMLHFFRVALFSCYTFCVALFPCYTIFMLFFFRVALLSLFPCYTIFMLLFLRVARFSCCTVMCELFLRAGFPQKTSERLLLFEKLCNFFRIIWFIYIFSVKKI